MWDEKELKGKSLVRDGVIEGDTAMSRSYHRLADLFPLIEGEEFEVLKADIARHGVRQPIVTYQGEILDGRNRWRACQELGILCPAEEYTGDDPLAYVISINLHRRHLNESQRAMVAARLATMRQGERTDLASIDAKSQEAAADLLNVSRSSVQRAAKVKDRGANELIEAVTSGALAVGAAAEIADLPIHEQRDLINRHDESAVLQASKEIRARRAEENRKRCEELRAQALSLSPPEHRYRTIVIDPPWPTQKVEKHLRPNQVGFDYPTMSLEEIAAYPLPAADECHLYLWTTQKFLPEAFKILEAWGFKYHFEMVWHKPGGPKPYDWPQLNHEMVLFARKGAFDFLDTKAFFTCFNAPRREHSRKPDEFYDVVRRVSPPPRIDLFSREVRGGFDSHGIEIGKFTGAYGADSERGSAGRM